MAELPSGPTAAETSPLASPPSSSPPPRQALSVRTWLLGLGVWAATTVLGAWLLTLPTEQYLFGGDFIGFWGAAKALSRGENPYDPVVLRRYVDDWRGAVAMPASVAKEIDHIPYYYPPWAVFPGIALLPLGFVLARNVWMTWVLQASAVSVGLLAARAGPYSFPMRVCIFGGTAVWIMPLRFGQVVAPTLLLLVLCLMAWEQGRDRWLGFLLVLAVVKPQISGLPVLLVLLASARDRRWNVWIFAGACAAAAALAACWLRPSWLFEFLAAPRLNPPPTAIESPFGGAKLGCSLWSGLMLLFGDAVAGIPAKGGWLAAAVAIQTVAAAAILIPLAKMVRNRDVSMERLISAGILASWFLSPYLRYYDLPMLLLPLAHLLNGRLPFPVKTAFAFVWVTAPLLDVFIDYRWLYGDGTALYTFFKWEFHWWWLALFIGAFWLLDAFWKSAAGDEAAEPAAAPEPPPAPATV